MPSGVGLVRGYDRTGARRTVLTGTPMSRAELAAEAAGRSQLAEPLSVRVGRCSTGDRSLGTYPGHRTAPHLDP